MFLELSWVEERTRSIIFSLLFSEWALLNLREEAGTLCSSSSLLILSKKSLMEFSSCSKQFLIKSTYLTVLALLVCLDLGLECLRLVFSSSRTHLDRCSYDLSSMGVIYLDSGSRLAMDFLSHWSLSTTSLTILSKLLVESSPVTNRWTTPISCYTSCLERKC